MISSIVTFCVFSGVKLSDSASDLLNQILSPIALMMWHSSSLNLSDWTDLSALIMLPCAYYYGNYCNDHH